MQATFVVIGGGISGVSCVETLAFLHPNEPIILVTESAMVKSIINLKMLTKTLSTFDVIEKDMNSLSDTNPMIKVIQDSLTSINSILHTIQTKKHTISYKYICLCMGASPKLIPQAENSPYVLGIRDTDSVQLLISKLGSAKKVILIGNGGIASELIHKIQNIQVEWVIKDKHITSTFMDPGAAEFFKSCLEPSTETSTRPETYRTHLKYTESDETDSGAALGPDWYDNFSIRGANSSRSINVHYQCEISSITYSTTSNSEFPVEVKLTNGDFIKCDLIISATGVVPRINITTDLELAVSNIDLGIKVDEHMRTSLIDVYAAGDVCSPYWLYAKHWFPMRLWSQARQMGCYAAKCMVAKLNNEELMQDFCFELYAHSTKLFGYKVILLGLYNGQTLGTDYECLIRMTKKVEFIKFVLKEGRLQGVILIGDTDLAETCENLILNQLDLTPYGDDILNPDIDIEDYFD